MKILITGGHGMLAQAIINKFKPENELIITDSKELDITNFDLVMQQITDLKPDLLINCAAYTNVDGAELEQNQELAEKVNAIGPDNLAKACAANGTVLVHISTDYVFGGDRPESEDYAEDDPKSPNSVYGKTKLQGEESIINSKAKYYIFRTAWLYGDGHNFVRSMLGIAGDQFEKGQKEAHLTVVCDQWGSPTYTEDLTNIVYQAVTEKIPFGVYNATNLGNTTWADFAAEIFKLAHANAEVEKITTAEYEAHATAKAKERGEERKVAPRPHNSQLSKKKLLDAGIKIPTWQDALKRYLKAEGKV